MTIDPDHPATAGLPPEWEREDEWYSFNAHPQNVDVILRLDDASYEGGTMGDDHPIAWAHSVGQGRSIYTGTGHTSESYTDPLFRGHLAGAVCWAARIDCVR